MIELTNEEKVQFIQQRLKQYAAQKFNLQLDLVAYQATQNATAAAHAQNEIAKLDLAYAAVEALLPEPETEEQPE